MYRRLASYVVCIAIVALRGPVPARADVPDDAQSRALYLEGKKQYGSQRFG